MTFLLPAGLALLNVNIRWRLGGRRERGPSLPVCCPTSKCSATQLHPCSGSWFEFPAFFCPSPIMNSKEPAANGQKAPFSEDGLQLWGSLACASRFSQSQVLHFAPPVSGVVPASCSYFLCSLFTSPVPQHLLKQLPGQVILLKKKS